MSEMVNQFYGAIRSGDVPALDALIDPEFCLICPTQDHVLSGVYRGKHRFFEEVTPHVFGSVAVESTLHSVPPTRSLLIAARWLSQWRKIVAFPAQKRVMTSSIFIFLKFETAA